MNNLWSTFLELDALYEDVYDFKSTNKNNWISMQPKANVQQPIAQSQPITKPAITSPNGKCVVVIVSDKGRLRAFGTDGVNPGAFVAFPNNLRQFEGQKYEVDQLIWNGKNYRVSGNIKEIKPVPLTTTPTSQSASSVNTQNNSQSTTSIDIPAILKAWLSFMNDVGLPGDTWYDYDLGDDDKVPLILSDSDLLNDLAAKIEIALKNEGLFDIFSTSDPAEALDDDNDKALEIISCIADEIVELLEL